MGASAFISKQMLRKRRLTSNTDSEVRKTENCPPILRFLRFKESSRQDDLLPPPIKPLPSLGSGDIRPPISYKVKTLLL